MPEATPTPPTPGSPEHNAAMIALAEGRITHTEKGVPVAPAAGGEPTTPNKPERPEWVPEKFWDAEKGEVRTEDLAKSYGELERAQSKASSGDEGQPPKTPEGAPAGGLDAALKAAHADYAKDGKLSDATLASLEKEGIPRNYAQAYVEGFRAQAQLARMSVFEAAGGEESFNSIKEWAANSLSEEQIAAFNLAVDSGNVESMRGAVSTVRALYEAANGSSPSTRVAPQGGAGNAPQPEAFRSRAEMTAAMSDPKYRLDPAYREQVARKIAGADALGINLMV